MDALAQGHDISIHNLIYNTLIGYILFQHILQKHQTRSEYYNWFQLNYFPNYGEINLGNARPVQVDMFLTLHCI